MFWGKSFFVWKLTLTIATHGIVKKSQKTPAKEIEKAEAIRQEYFNNKQL